MGLGKYKVNILIVSQSGRYLGTYCVVYMYVSNVFYVHSIAFKTKTQFPQCLGHIIQSIYINCSFCYWWQN